MYNSYPEFEGIRLKVDSFIAYKGQDSVMPIFFEEQPITWLLFEKEITDLCHKLSSPSILDVGCGSGFWSILLKKKFPQANVYALDKNKRAIEYTTLNSKDNYTDINIQKIAFEEASYDIKFDIIILTPPYHLFPANRNLKIPFFADGGDMGLTEFYKQLEIAFKLLGENGAILFNQMSVGGNKPSYVDVINKISQGHSDLHYINILEPIETTQFIDSLYPINEYQHNSSDDIIVMSSDINILYYTSGLIKKNSNRFVVSDSNYSEYRSDIKKYCDINNLNYKEPIWEDRIDLHREINSFTPSKRLGILNSNINCNLAKNINNPTEAFGLSGCNMLVNEITKIIKTDSFVLDFSTIASIIDSNNNTLTDFITVVNNNDDFWSREENVNIQEKLSLNYEHIYKPLKDNNIGVYYHPNFFYSPTSNGIHVSMDPNTFNLDLSNKASEKNDYNFNEISDNIWFSNVSFSLSYNEFINKTKEPVFSIKKRCHILHGLYCEYYNIKRKSSLLICIPLIGYPFYHNNRYNGLGAIFLYIVTSDIRKYTTKTIQTIANRLSVIGKDITYAYSFNIGKTLADNVTREAIKSAKAAIMSRNMSHNLGSHVMAYLKQRLNSVEDIIKENSLASVIKNNSLLGDASENYEVLNKLIESINSGKTIDPEEVELPFLVGLGKFINYIQERQDFIATIATSYIPYTSPVNFKDAIYDELNPDLRHLRHKERSGHKPDNILLAYIAKSEGLERINFDGIEDKFFEDNNDIIIRFRDFKGLVLESRPDRASSQDSLEEMKKYEFALPGGTIGRQALFSIIENIIRNAAKHGSRKQNQNLELSIDILDLANDSDHIAKIAKYDTGYSLEAFNKKTLNEGVLNDVEQLSLSFEQLLNTKYKTAKDIDDLYIVTITDNLPLINNEKKKESEQKFLDLVNAAKTPYIDPERNVMDNTCKGLKEMRISAAWLRGIVDENINPANNAPIVTIRAAMDETGECHLQYLICIQKPRNIAVITMEELEVFKNSENRKQDFIHAGWRFFTLKEWENANKSFEIILAEENLCTPEFKVQAPDRLVELSVSAIEEVILASEQMYDDNSSGYDRGYAYLWNLLLKDRGRIHKNYYSIVKSKFVIDENVLNEDMIYIEDGKAYDQLTDKNISKDETYKILANGKVRLYHDVNEAFQSINLFRTHHGLDQISSLAEFYKLKFNSKNKIKRYVETSFVEGITGHNSTDRLIRNKSINDIWYFKQMNAIKTKIALFDERIFKKITNLSDDVILEEFEKNNSVSILTNEKATLMTQKGIYVLNIIENKYANTPEFLIFGIDDLLPELKANSRDYEARVKAKLIGRIVKGDNDMAIQIKYEKDCKEYFGSNVENSQGHRFDYMTIHQGLLDKLYNKLRVSEKRIETTDIMKKHFIKHSENNGLVIHSGRSRPSLKDMPQKAPFIQFAAIDTAILDSKSTFVELLNFAYYEENNS